MLPSSFQWLLLLFFSITVTRIVPDSHEIPFFRKDNNLEKSIINLTNKMTRKNFLDELSIKKLDKMCTNYFLGD